MSEDCARCDNDILRPLASGGSDSGGGGFSKCEYPGCNQPAVTVVRGKRYCAMHAALVLSQSY